MTTAIDTNVVDALWDKDPTLSLAVRTALEAAFNRGSLVAAPVFAELIVAQHLLRSGLRQFFAEYKGRVITIQRVDWNRTRGAGNEGREALSQEEGVAAGRRK